MPFHIHDNHVGVIKQRKGCFPKTLPKAIAISYEYIKYLITNPHTKQETLT